MLLLLETLMFEVSQYFLLPVLLAVVLLFLLALHDSGRFLLQLWQSRRGSSTGELSARLRAHPQLSLSELEQWASRRLEVPRLTSRVAPMLGLVATMIPMGPALRALSDGQLTEMSRSLMVAFSAVILALVAASLSFLMLTVRRRWYASELSELERARGETQP